MTRLWLFFAVALVACAPPVVVYSGRTSAPMDETIACLTNQLQRMGYTVESADRKSGSVKARKQGRGSSTPLGPAFYTQINAAVLPAKSDSDRVVRVTATVSREESPGGRPSIGLMTMPQGERRDAEALRSACSRSPAS